MLKAVTLLLALVVVAPSAEEPLVLTSYEDALSAMRKYSVPGILVFTAKWCEPCQTMKTETWAPLMPELKQSYIVYFVDTDDEPDVYRAWSKKGTVTSLPAYVVLNRGASSIIASEQGMKSKYEFVLWLNKSVAAAPQPCPPETPCPPGGG